jgi:hypothetical protein
MFKQLGLQWIKRRKERKKDVKTWLKKNIESPKEGRKR